MTGEFFSLLKAPFVKTAETNTRPSVPHPQEHSLGTSLPPGGSFSTLPRLHHRPSFVLTGADLYSEYGFALSYPTSTTIRGLAGCLPILCTAWNHTEEFISQQRKSSPCQPHPPPPPPPVPGPATYPIPGTKSKSFPCPIPFVHGAKHPMHLTLLLTASFLPLSPRDFSGGDGRGTRGPLPHSSHSSPGPGNLVPQDTSHLGSQHA